MCFFIRTPSRIAKKNIVCYKEVIRESAGIFKSEYQGFTYKLGREYRRKKFGFLKDRRKEIYGIGRGFHSYRFVPRSYATVLRCIIPKGTEYYYNSINKQYVSLAIRIEEVVR